MVQSPQRILHIRDPRSGYMYIVDVEVECFWDIFGRFVAHHEIQFVWVRRQWILGIISNVIFSLSILNIL